jgi:hypothetical protein
MLDGNRFEGDDVEEADWNLGCARDVSSGSYIRIKTLTLFRMKKKRGVLSFCLGVRLFGLS